MLTKDDRKLIKYLKKLYQSGRNQIAEYNSFYYLSDIKKDDEGQINWYFNNSYEGIKEHILYATILSDTIPIDFSIVEKMLLRKPIDVSELNKDQLEFYNHFIDAEKCSNIDVFIEKVQKLVKVINKQGKDIKIYIFKNAKEALPKAIQIDSKYGEDEYSFSNMLMQIEQEEKESYLDMMKRDLVV